MFAEESLHSCLFGRGRRKTESHTLLLLSGRSSVGCRLLVRESSLGHWRYDIEALLCSGEKIASKPPQRESRARL
jgi:hypothetical protein